MLIVNCAEKPFVIILFLNNKKTIIFSYSDLYIDTNLYLPNKNELLNLLHSYNVITRNAKSYFILLQIGF